MKQVFYYKEEFPLEIRITLENIHELRLLTATLTRNEAVTLTDTIAPINGRRKTETLEFLSKERENNGNVRMLGPLYNMCEDVMLNQENKILAKLEEEQQEEDEA